jgi:protein transport protein SEC31
MTKLKSIDKLAVSAWSPASQPLLALGTAAGAIDTSFSTSAELEIFDLNLMKNGLSMKKVGSLNVPSKFVLTF